MDDVPTLFASKYDSSVLDFRNDTSGPARGVCASAPRGYRSKRTAPHEPVSLLPRAVVCALLIFGIFSSIVNAQLLPDTTGTAVQQPAPEIRHFSLTIDAAMLAEGAFQGTAQYHLQSQTDSLASLFLRAANLEIQDASLQYADSTRILTNIRQGSGDSLIVPINQRVPTDTTVVLTIDYRGSPGPGIYTQVTSEDVLSAAWTSGVPHTNRFWFPTFERLDDRFSSELRVTLPAPLSVVAAGTHVSTTSPEEGTNSYLYRVEEPLPSSLLGFAAGSYENVRASVQQQDGSSVILEYLVPPERIGDARRTFRATPDAMRFLSDRLGVAYPWPIYRQAVVPGIRPARTHPPTTALLPDSLMVDQRAEVDFPAHYVVAYSLAHQWTGVMITPESWADSWIQQGLSAYLAAEFLAETQGSDVGHLRLQQQEQEYLASRMAHRRALAPSSWSAPAELFAEGHAAKGARIFQMLERQMGADAFRAALQELLSAYQFQTVSTTDIRETFEEASGQSLDRFFDQWIYGAGHPVVRISQAYNASIDSLSIQVQQLQTDRSSGAPFFFDLPVIVHGLMGSTDATLSVRSGNEVTAVSVGGEPRFVEFDPADTILDSIDVRQPASAWIRQLNEGNTVLSRLQAAREARQYAEDPSLRIGLKGALSGSLHPEVRAAVIKTMGSLPPTGTINTTIRQAANSDLPIVRAAALTALRQSKNPERARRIALESARNDTSYSVQAAAVRTLAHLGGDNAFSVLQSAFVTSSHNELIRRAAFDGLTILDPPLSRSLPTALKWSEPDVPPTVRAAAPNFFADHLSNARVRSRMSDLLEDKDLRVRRAAVDALAAEGSDRAASLLEQRLDDEEHPWVRMAIRAALGSED